MPRPTSANSVYSTSTNSESILKHKPRKHDSHKHNSHKHDSPNSHSNTKIKLANIAAKGFKYYLVASVVAIIIILTIGIIFYFTVFKNINTDNSYPPLRPMPPFHFVGNVTSTEQELPNQLKKY